MAKLTLHVPEDLVAAAKTEAVARQVSLSKLVSDFCRNLASQSNKSKEGDVVLAPRTNRLAGCIPKADMESYIDYLEEKNS